MTTRKPKKPGAKRRKTPSASNRAYWSTLAYLALLASAMILWASTHQHVYEKPVSYARYGDVYTQAPVSIYLGEKSSRGELVRNSIASSGSTPDKSTIGLSGSHEGSARAGSNPASSTNLTPSAGGTVVDKKVTCTSLSTERGSNPHGVASHSREVQPSRRWHLVPGPCSKDELQNMKDAGN